MNKRNQNPPPSEEAKKNRPKPPPGPPAKKSISNIEQSILLSLLTNPSKFFSQPEPMTPKELELDLALRFACVDSRQNFIKNEEAKNLPPAKETWWYNYYLSRAKVHIDEKLKN